ncbi:MAG: thiamine phosphate synthase, partial [Gemmatimonadota bacterium]
MIPPPADPPGALDLRLIVITDAGIAAPRAVEDVVAAAVEAGAPAVQLRKKGATAAELYRDALRLRDITRTRGARLFVNDRADVALAARADG